MDKFKLIAEVKGRPHLWQIPVNERDKDIVKNIWNEIAESLGATEKMCRMEWKQLRSLYGRKKERREKHIESLKKKRIYDKNKNYDVKWIYFEPLNFLKVVFEDNISNHNLNSDDTKVVQRPSRKISALKLIAEIKERKYLWKTSYSQRDKKIWDYLWSEVVECTGASVERAKAKWHELRRLYRKEKERIEGQIELLQQNRVNDENENCDRKWKFYKHMQFLDHDPKVTEVHCHPTGEVDKFRLIAEVKKRPYLWKKGVKGSIQLFNYFWSEVAEVFGVKVGEVRSKWNFLRRCYKDKYVALRRENLTYDECIVKNWVYFTHLKFLNIIFDAEYKFTTLDTNETDQNFDEDNFDANNAYQDSNSSDSDTLDGYCKIEVDDRDHDTDSELEDLVNTTSSRKKQNNKLNPGIHFTRTSENSLNKSDFLKSEIKEESMAYNHNDLAQNDQLQNEESMCIKEETVNEYSELTNLPIKSEESIGIKVEPESEMTSQQNDQFTIYTISEIKEEVESGAELTTKENFSLKEEPQF